MKKLLKKLVMEEEAQGMVEYILIVALVALVVVGAVRMFGGKVQKLFSDKAGELEGISNETQKK